MQKYLLIAIGGALGSIARYWVGSTVAGRMGIRFPYGTLIVNITYSTFSTYEWETLSTIRSGAFAIASLYAVGSLILGLAAVWGGAWIAEAIS